MHKSTKLLLKAFACMLGAAALLPGAVHAAPTDLASQPLAQPASNVKPNIMVLFDDSGSMRQQYTPDYIGRFGWWESNPLCFDSLDYDMSITSTLQDCEAGDPPIMSPDLNTQYYNPEIRYFPAANYDGTSMPSMNATYTTNWTAVPTDGVSSSTLNVNRYDTAHMFPAYGEPTATTSNLASGYPDRLWCTSQPTSTQLTDATWIKNNCRTNSGYSYPDPTYGYGWTQGGPFSGGTIAFTFGAPYYYRIVPTEYCTDATLTTCISATSPTTVGGVLYGVPAPVRYCNDTTLSTCEAKYRGTYTRPKFTGIASGTISGSSQPATGTITVGPQHDSASGTITAIYVGGTSLWASGTTIGATGPISDSTVALNIVSAINAGGTGFTASVPSGGTTVTVTAPFSSGACVPADCTFYNGAVVTVQSPGTPTASATASFRFTFVNNNGYVSGISVQGTQLFSSSITCSGCSNTSSGRQDWMAQQVAAAINANTSSTGYSASWSSTGNVTITGPLSAGSSLNGVTASISYNRRRVGVSTSTPQFGGGVTTGDIETSAVNFSGGVNSGQSRTNVGKFVRTSIVPYADPPTNSIPATYARYPGRTDCVAQPGVCTYSEEMTNFSNWYAYYRTRNEMAKTAIGRAFAGLTSAFRVGFITINPGSPVSSAKYLKIDDFNSGAGLQRDLWYQHLYAADANGSTPLREAVSRVGQYLALGSSGTLTGGMDASPIQVACQRNYTVLVTDGYWNGNAGQTLSGGSIGNQDNTDSGYHTRAIGAYDGGLSGSTNTLADTAMYYYQTDLRSDLADEVPTTQADPNPQQHMNLFTVGLGLAGQLNYDPNYLTATSGDFYDIKQGSLNWPVPAANSETALDDLWHAAVDGHGQFFSAKDPVTLSNALVSALSAVNSTVGAGAAAATSNLEPVAGDNFAFTAQYQTVQWTGDLTARTIDLSTGIVAYASLWSAASMLDQRNQYNRYIFTFDPTDTTAGGGQNGNLLKSFCWPGAFATGNYPGCNDGAELSTADMSNFNPLTLPQAINWSTDGSGRNTSATPQNLVDYLRGDTTNYSTGGTATTDLYRARAHLLGDIVDAQPAYVKAPPFGYDSGSYAGVDPGYQTFKSNNATRRPTVFAAANDGMLHAFNTAGPNGEIYYQTAGISTASTADDAFTGTLVTSALNGQGSERWAYVPSMLLPQLENLADIPYSHQYYTDGSPAVGDVCLGTCTAGSAAGWHTILVAGLNGGGRGYYALDITDPNNPKGLWEFSASSSTPCLSDMQANSASYYQDCNLGYSFGNPLIVKRPSDGKWVVIVTSGYNNVNPGNGQGYLYILDAGTGKILNRIGTGVGCDGVSTTSPCVAGTVDPSGLNRINAWVDNAYYNNTAMRVYGVDLKGNVWRFQLDPTASGYLTAFRLETLTDASGNPQPITTKPELASVSNFPVVYVATGRLLGTSDLTNTQVQSVYALKDDLSSTPLPNVRTSGQFVQQTLTAIPGASPPQRTTTANSVDFNVKDGWWTDLPDSGERVNVDPQLQLGTLIVPSNVPSTDTCVAGGYSWLNFFDYRTGSYIAGSTLNMVSTKISASLIVGINVVKLPGGSVKAIVTTADNQQLTQTAPVTPTTVQGRRVSWRELISQ
ncbi:MAG: PilC/PilY family type IV pilus protein [Betaproteobacteria bacterium]|nr:PilC/PilY family type IV pilus protein [Betaproteobacteria bacterium]